MLLNESRTVINVFCVFFTLPSMSLWTGIDGMGYQEGGLMSPERDTDLLALRLHLGKQLPGYTLHLKKTKK